MSEPISSELRDMLALALVPGMGPKLTAALLGHFGDAAAVRQASAEEFREIPQIGDKLSKQFADHLRRLDIQAEINLIQNFNVWLAAKGTPAYPTPLRDLETAPSLLYARGTYRETDDRAIAIVGSRHCSAYGRRVAEQIAGGLARAGVTVVSGLARGIDGCAHRGALQAGGRTVAVLAGGLSKIYPPEHAELAAEVEQSGCLFSETPMTFEPLPAMFPARNRIISGLSQAVVIIEAGDKSGALITARLAAEQGREVFAVPANADSVHSAGTLQLLRDGARLVRHADDILEDLGGIPAVSARRDDPTEHDEEQPPPTKVPPPNLDANQLRIWELLADGPKPIDQLTQVLEIPVQQINSMLMMLEMKRIIRRLPGNMYTLFAE